MDFSIPYLIGNLHLEGFGDHGRMSNNEVEQTLERIQNHKGVNGVIVVNSEGIPIRSSMDTPTTLQYVQMSKTLTLLARGLVRDVDPQNDLTILRIRTQKYEVIIAPERREDDKESQLIVIQNGDWLIPPMTE